MAIAIGGTIVLGVASMTTPAQVTVDIEHRYPRVGAIRVWRVADAGRPIEPPIRDRIREL
jgi:hypothetical protein